MARSFTRIAPAALAAALAVSLHAGLARSAEIAVDLELVLAVDVSGSVDEEEGKLQRMGYVSAFRSPSVLRAIRSGRRKRIAATYVEWAGYDFQTSVVGWRGIHDRASAEAFAALLARRPVGRGPYTSISGAIEFALTLFEGSGFRGERRVIDISGDGPNNSGDFVTAARAKALRAGVTINGLPIMNGRPSPWGRAPMPNLDLYYRKCVIGGRRSFLVVADGFGSFGRAVRRKLALEIVGAPAPPPARSAKRAPLLASGAAAAAGALPVARAAPPCDAGERRRGSWSDAF